MSYPTPWSSPRAKKALPHVGAVAWRLAAAVGVLWLAYFLIATTVLLTPIVRSAASSGGIRLDYAWAFSPWPGRVLVKDLEVRVEDYNVQFLIGIDRGSLDLSLHELLRRRFHAFEVDAEGVSFRMRHKLSRVGKEGPRVAAYPRIAGLADPPLFVGTPPPPIPDDQYDLWDVRVENVNAQLKELWVLEYRYLGPGVARGSFHLAPARNYEVSPATLELHGGPLTLGDAFVARSANLKIDCRVAASDTRKLKGLEPLRAIVAGAKGTFAGGDLRFLDAYLGPHAGLSAQGAANVKLDVRFDGGVIAPGTRIELQSPDASVGGEQFRVSGAAAVRVGVPRGAPGSPLELRVDAEHLQVSGRTSGISAPSLERVAAQVDVTSDLADSLEVRSFQLWPTTLNVPDLQWISREVAGAPELGGAASLGLEGKRDEAGLVQGAARAKATALGVRAGSFRTHGGDAKVDARFASTKSGSGVAMNDVNLSIEHATLHLDDRQSQPWSGTVASNDLEVRPDEATLVRGTVDLHSGDARVVMPLVVDSPVARRIETMLLGLKELDARAAFHLGDVKRFELLRARSGAVSARGVLTFQRQGPTGAFLLSTALANLGFSVRAGETSVELLVGDGWLEKNGLSAK